MIEIIISFYGFFCSFLTRKKKISVIWNDFKGIFVILHNWIELFCLSFT